MIRSLRRDRGLQVSECTKRVHDGSNALQTSFSLLKVEEQVRGNFDRWTTSTRLRTLGIPTYRLLVGGLVLILRNNRIPSKVVTQTCRGIDSVLDR